MIIAKIYLPFLTRARLTLGAMALSTAASCGGAAPPQTTRISSEVVGPTQPPAPRASTSETTQPWSDGTSTTAPNRFVEKDGVRFAYRAFGRKPGVPLVFLAPLRGTMDSWDPQLVDRFAEEGLVILFDNIGVGLTNGAAPTTVTDAAKDAETFIDALRELHFTDLDWLTGHVDLMGLSVGGFVAQQLALNRPDLVDRVVLAGTAPQTGQGFDPAPPEIAKREAADPQTSDDLLFLLFAKSDASQAAGRAFLARTEARQKDRDAPVTMKTVLAQLASIKAWSHASPETGRYAYLASIKQPVLVADGESDVILPTENSKVLARNLPNAKLVLYPDSGQGFLFQHADAFANDVSSFLQR